MHELDKAVQHSGYPTSSSAVFTLRLNAEWRFRLAVRLTGMLNTKPVKDMTKALSKATGIAQEIEINYEKANEHHEVISALEHEEHMFLPVNNSVDVGKVQRAIEKLRVARGALHDDYVKELDVAHKIGVRLLKKLIKDYNASEPAHTRGD